MLPDKKTKIIATIGPSSNNEKTIEKFIALGVNGMRLNFSHGSHQEHGDTINLIRKIEKKLNRHVAIIVDVQGPKIRVGNLPEQGIALKPGQEIVIDTGTREYYENRIPLPSLLFRDGTKEGHLVFFDDGAMHIKITKKYAGIFKAIVITGGILLPKKGVNVPELENNSSILNPKDKADIAFAVKSKADYVAISFIKDAKDIKGVKKFLGKSDIRIIAKIERPEALKNLEGIIDESDAIMIARGDLGIETPLWELPIRQKEITEAATRKAKPVIVATQMLDSMIRNPLPTRAEVSDVANAVFDSSDAVMLSGETALGKYPVEAVDMMRKILEATDVHQDNFCEYIKDGLVKSPLLALARSTIAMAGESGAKIVVVLAEDETLAQIISHFRLNIPIMAVTKKLSTAKILSLTWGVTPLLLKDKSILDRIKECLIKNNGFKKGDKIVFTNDSAEIIIETI